MIVECLTTFDQFVSLRAEWNDLAKSQVRTIFLTHLWLEEWWQVFGNDHQLYVLLAREDDRLVGILPLVLSGIRYGTRKLEFMGAGEVTPNHLDIIADTQKRPLVVQAFTTYLVQVKSDWDILELDKLPEDSPNLDALKSGFSSLGFLITTEESARCPYTELPSSFDEYLNSRSSTTRESYRRAKRRIARDFPDLRFEVTRAPEKVKEALSILVHLHQKRWRNKGYPGAFSNERVVNYHQKMAAHALHDDLLRLYTLQIGSEIIAIYYCYRVGDVTQYYLGAFDDQWSRYSPGNLINMFAIEQSILDASKIFDFLEGEEDYKAHWANKHRANHRMMIFVPNLRGRITYSVDTLTRAIKDAGVKYIPVAIRRPVWLAFQRWMHSE